MTCLREDNWETLDGEPRSAFYGCEHFGGGYWTTGEEPLLRKKTGRKGVFHPNIDLNHIRQIVTTEEGSPLHEALKDSHRLFQGILNP